MHPKLIAIVGGSGSGKTWLARQLQLALGPAATRLSLDDFYRDRRSLTPRQRTHLNYDHPLAIDWRCFERVLRAIRAGKTAQVPRYCFETHTRHDVPVNFAPGSVVLIDGLWLLLPRRIRAMFDYAVFLDCPENVRLERRTARDVAERGRTEASVREQFYQTVAPMHDRFVAPQALKADRTLKHPPHQADLESLITTIRALVLASDEDPNASAADVAVSQFRPGIAPMTVSAARQRQPDKRWYNHCAAMRTRMGRGWLTFHVRWQRVLWRWRLEQGELLKRGFDIVASGLFLLVFSPLYLLIALLIKLEDGGPVIFAQRRVGQFGREFRMFKFRSMCVDAEARLKEILAQNQHRDGVTFKVKNDPRLTRYGKWLRKLSLDELPQMWNVLKGDMSLVGPRPPLPREVERYSLADRRRLAIKPGITCLWQIGGRSEIDFSGQVKLDVEYIETRNLWADLKILLKTLPAVAGGKGAC